MCTLILTYFEHLYHREFLKTLSPKKQIKKRMRYSNENVNKILIKKVSLCVLILKT